VHSLITLKGNPRGFLGFSKEQPVDPKAAAGVRLVSPL
jgi:hypothetical protein